MEEMSQTTMVYFNDTDNSGFAETGHTMDRFGDEVSEGDYVAVVYQTPSNGGSWHRFCGEVSKTREFQGRVDDVWIEADNTDRDESGETAHLHVNPETGDYSFTDNIENGLQWGIKKLAFTPE